MDLTLTIEANRPLGALRRCDDRWIIDRAEPHVSIRLKQLFPRIPKSAVPPYSLPADPLTSADIEWFTTRYAFEIASDDLGELKARKELFHRNAGELDAILLPDWQPREGGVGLRDGQTGRQYQHQAVEVVMRRGSLLLGDVGGLGKTYVGGLLCIRPGVLPAAIVVEAHLQQQWKEKLEAFTTLRVHCIKTTNPLKEKLPEADVYIWRYSQLAGWVDTFEKLRLSTVVFDEIQKLRTGLKSAMGRAAKRLATLAQRRLGLTGSPIYGYGIEIFDVMQFVDELVLGMRDDFMREWTKDGKYLSDPKALGTYLREQHVYLRRTKEDVGQQMEPVNRIVQAVEHNQHDLDDIEAVIRKLATQVAFGSFTERGEAARELDWRLRHATGVSKARSVAAYVRMLLENDQPVLLAGWHHDVYDIWRRELAAFNPAFYTGSESPAQKEKAKRAAMSGETNLVIISLRSGAGLDGLQYRFSDLVIGELDWAPGVHQQLIWRLDREGQENPVTAHFLVSDDGSDPVVISRLGIKASEARGVNDPHLGVEQVETDLTNIQALARRYLNKAQLAKLDAQEPVA
ncbi:MAG TPA: SNF2-related protein [Kaistia sp.]|nr:SNF2-related protein [Kaistia sp.]